MRRICGVCALLSLLALGAAAAAADPPVPLYLQGGDRPGGEFAVLSNGGWRVKSTPLLRPHIVSVSQKGRPDLTSARERQDISSVWAPTCSVGSQVVSFVRDVVLPGRPSEIGFEWNQTGPWGGAFAWAELYVNRALVFTSKAGGRRIEHDKTKARLALFRDGVNHLEVRVKKNAIPVNFPKLCNIGGPSRNYGVSFLVQGKFATDVAVRTDIAATEIRRTGFLVP